MSSSVPVKIISVAHLFERLPENERIIMDVLRQIILETLPSTCREKISYNVPCYFGKKRICLIWPASIPRGGVKEGVLLGFWYGNRLHDEDQYLERGTNKQVFYKIYTNPGEIDENAVKKLLREAFRVDSL